MPASPAAKPAPRRARGRVTAEGVFAELESVRPILAAHQQTLAPKLIPPLAQRIKNIIPDFKPEIKKDQQKLEQVSTEIAQETVREALENLGRIQDVAQIHQVVADSLTSSIVTHPQINPDLGLVVQEKPAPAQDEEKIQKTAQKAVAQVVKDNQADLEKAAVLKNVENISNLQAQGHAPAVISEQVDNFIHQNSLPDPKDSKETLTAQVGRFVLTYASNFNQTVTPGLSQNRISTLAQLNQIKTQAYEQSLASLKQRIAPKEGSADIETLTQNVSHLLSFKPLTEDHVQKLGLGRATPKILTFARQTTTTANFGMGIALATNQRAQQEGFLSSLAGPKLDGEIAQKAKFLEELKRQRALSYQERKKYLQFKKELSILNRAQDFSQKQPQKVQSYVSTYLQTPTRARLDWTNDAWQVHRASFNYYPGVYVLPPPSRRINFLMPTRFFGAQAAKIGNFAKTGKAAMQVGKLAGGGAIAPATLMAIALKPIRDIGKLAGGALVGLGLYFLGLGKIAMAGFMIGAGIGGTVGLVSGTIIGLQVAAVCGPFAPACALVTVPTFALTGGFIGAAIGGTAGALIALGLASGSATMASMGAGAAAGGTIGGVVGFNVGAGLTATVMTAAIGACIFSVLCAPFAPFLIAVAPAVVWVGGFVGAAVGATVGALVGATAGYFFGHYVIPAFSNSLIAIKNFFSGAFSATGAGVGGFFGAAGSFFTGLASTMWGGIVSAGGGIFSGLSSIGGALFSGLGSGASITSLASISVFGGIGTISIGSVIIGITASAAFFNPDPTGTQLIGGDNEFFVITKSANDDNLENTDLPATIIFTITLQAKEIRLTGISFSDQINVTSESGSFSITQDLTTSCDPRPVNALEAGEVWECQFEFEARNQNDRNFNDSLIVNTVSVTAIPEGASQIRDSAAASVRIGNPPTNCPSGWPARTGRVSQGPEGGTSHGDPPVAFGDGGLEAIDIALFHEPVYSTVDGTVLRIWQGSGAEDYRVAVSTTCPNLQVVHFWHLLSVHPNVSLNQQINSGDIVGISGLMGTGYHTHYQFNDAFDRDPQITDFLPKPVPRSCDGEDVCNVSIP